jgi:hypothetical protein
LGGAFRLQHRQCVSRRWHKERGAWAPADRCNQGFLRGVRRCGR